MPIGPEPAAKANGQPGPKKPPRLLFRRSQRLAHALQFQAVYAGKCSIQSGPLRVHARLNGETPSITRLGLSVGRRVGPAVTRNRVKRLLREAFRLSQRELPLGIDLVIVVHPHDKPELAAYTNHLKTAAATLAGRLHRAEKKSGGV